jgi:ribosomal protein L16 Arg81 hydroxylase
LPATGPRKDAYSLQQFGQQLLSTPPEATRTIVLNTGELLFVPRGWLHRTQAQQEPTPHITFGVLPTWFDLVIHILDLAQFEAAHDPALRALVNSPEAGSNPEHLRQLLQRVLAATDLRSVQHYFQQLRP